jgi:hypothetical protein
MGPGEEERELGGEERERFGTRASRPRGGGSGWKLLFITAVPINATNTVRNDN